MSRWYSIGFVAVALLATSPVVAVAREWEEDFGPEGEEVGRADVTVDIQASTPGLDEAVFRRTLGGQGEWLQSPRYGNVWRPSVAVGWRPYYYGAWLWTDEGWYWNSDEPFAWAVYHYGRWVYDPSWGWVWVPGYEWAPAWVAWRYGGDAVGWAPLGPGVSVFVTAYPFVDFWWTFVPTTQFVGVPVYTVAYAPREVPRWYRATAPAPPRQLAPRGGRAPAPAWGGPSRLSIEERIGRPVASARPSALRGSPAFRPGLRGQEPAAPGRVDRPGVMEPSRRGGEPGRARIPGPFRDERGGGPGAFPAPGGSGERGRGRGPDAAPAPGWSGDRGVERGRAPDAAPPRGWSRPSEGGGRPAFEPPSRGDGGGRPTFTPPSRGEGGGRPSGGEGGGRPSGGDGGGRPSGGEGRGRWQR